MENFSQALQDILHNDDAGERYLRLQSLDKDISAAHIKSKGKMSKPGRLGFRIGMGSVYAGFMALGAAAGTTGVQLFVLLPLALAINPIILLVGVMAGAVGATAGEAYFDHGVKTGKYKRSTEPEELSAVSKNVKQEIDRIAQGPVEDIMKSTRCNDLLRNGEIARRVQAAFQAAAAKTGGKAPAYPIPPPKSGSLVL